MKSSQQQTPVQTTPAAHIVGNAFVDQYYHMLHESPELVHRFYQDVSKFGRPEKNGIMGITTTMEDINKKILSLDYGELGAEIISVDAQESNGGGVLVLVTGCTIGKNKTKQKFTQCFFLAPQEKGYFVLNDVFRYLDDNGCQETAHDDFESPITHDHVEDPSALETQSLEQISVTAVNGDQEEVYNPENGEASIGEDEAPASEVVDESPDGSHVASVSVCPTKGVPKKSYASIVKVMKEGATPSSSTTETSVRSSTKSQEQQWAAPPPPNMSEANGSLTNTKESSNAPEAEAEGYSIHVKGLSNSATPSLLGSVFKQFGPIKNGGIQVRSQRGFCFGFVEFEVESAAQSALEASPILIDGRYVVVEEKRSTTKVNSKGRFVPGRRPGYRNEGPKERGNYGNGNYGNGRGYGRGEYNNSRGDYGNRNGNQGGFSNHGADQYQRRDQIGTSGRRNRNGGLTGNSPVKTTSVHVAASA